MAALRCAAAAASLSVAAAVGWQQDGGSPYRLSSATLTQDISVVTPHKVFTYTESAEDTVSQVEGYLLQSPLVTSFGEVLIMTDACIVTLLQDPVGLNAGTVWLPYLGQQWSPYGLPATVSECEAAGLVLDSGDRAYFVDGRNQAVHQLQLTKSKMTYVTSWVFNKTVHKGNFGDDVSLLAVPNAGSLGSMQLWVPLKGEMFGTDGLFMVIDTSTTDGSYTIAGKTPLPNNGLCTNPYDAGTTLLTYGPNNAPGVAVLSQEDCGLMVLDGASMQVTYSTFPTEAGRSFLGDGEHSHPIFDRATGNLYFLDHQPWDKPQLLCCRNTAAFATCAGWPGERDTQYGPCVPLPAEGVDSAEGGVFHWDWMAGAFYNNLFYVAMSGLAGDEGPEKFQGLGDYLSALSVFDTTSGALLATYRFSGDFFNSAPLVVAGSGGVGSVSVFLTSNTGKLYAFPGGAALGGGPSWTTSGEIPGIPLEDLPTSTFSYLSVTASGTLLVTSSAGGADWQDEKSFVAIVNGVFPPSAAAAAASGIGAGAKAGIAITVLLVLGGGFGYAYATVPAVKAAVGSLGGAISSVTGKLGGASSGYKGFGSPTGAGAERGGLLAGAGAAASSAPTAASPFGGSSYSSI